MVPGTYQRWHLFIVVVGFFEASVYAVATGRIIGPKGPGSVCSGIVNPLSVNVWTGPAAIQGLDKVPILGHLLECLESVRISSLALTQMETQISNTTSRGFDCIPIYGDIVGRGTHAI